MSNLQDNGDIAVIGLSGRFPCSDNLDQFWEHLKAGRELIKHFTVEELKAAGVDQDLINNQRYVKSRGILHHIDQFDAEFFGMSGYEAAITDPQQRLLIELCWQALEQAGYMTGRYNGKVGVFMGMSTSTYLQNNLLHNKEFLASQLDYQTTISNSASFIATKISYLLNLSGPSITVNTACSTSLAAIIMACQSLLLYDSDITIAGGVRIHIPQYCGYLYQEGGVLSPDGHCRAFSDIANGTAVGNAAGVVVLKRLTDAKRDNDCIDAIIRGFALNNDGSAKAGYTAPSIIGQTECIKMALEFSSINPETITYVEAHGTGTKLGDPIEITSLTNAYRSYTNKRNYCALGSVKTTIGHTDTAAGVSGFIKAVLCLKHKAIPASLHFERPNAMIDFANTPFYVNTRYTPWQSQHFPRRAGVSSFGIGGTNAHVILEEAPPSCVKSHNEMVSLLVCSGRTKIDLDHQRHNLKNCFVKRDYSASSLANVAYTLAMGRKHFSHRHAYLCIKQDNWVDALESNDILPMAGITKQSIAFLFSGQGTLYPGVARQLYGSEARFKQSINQCLSYLSQPVVEEVSHYLLSDVNQSQLNKTYRSQIKQLALFVFEYSLAQFYMALGIKPQAMLGHSLGEYVAACLSGVLNLKDTIDLITYRGALVDQLPTGMLLAVPMSYDQLNEYVKFGEELSVAAINSPVFCTLSGSVNQLSAVKSRLDALLKKDHLRCVVLETCHAFHSPLMSGMCDPYLSYLNDMSFSPPNIPYISNVTGQWISSPDITPRYFIDHLIKPVRFSEGISCLMRHGYRVFIEIGAGKSLSTFVKQISDHRDVLLISSVPHRQLYMSDQQSSWYCLLKSLATCWVNGIDVEWQQYYTGKDRSTCRLPTYPFNKSRCWIAPSASPIQSKRIAQHSIEIRELYWQVSPYDQGCTVDDKIILYFSDGSKFTDQLIAAFNGHAKRVIIVTTSSTYRKCSDNKFCINPDELSHYRRLFHYLSEKNSTPLSIIHAWTLTAHLENRLYPHPRNLQSIGFLSIVNIAKTFCLETNSRSPILSLFIITNKLHRIQSSECAIPDKATLIGSALSLKQEYQLDCRIVDIGDSYLDCLNKDHLDIVNEISSPSQDFLVAYRRGIRLTKHYRIKKMRTTGNLLASNGIYLITGGLSRLGLHLAQYLARGYKAHIILLATSKKSYRAKSAWVDDKLKEIQTVAKTLEIVFGDITDKTAMAAVLERIKNNYLRIDGIFHLAASRRDNRQQLLRDITAASMVAQFSVKILGTDILRELIETINIVPKFCVLYSSIASILGGVGLATYAASNSYLDSLAINSCGNSQCRWISISWDAWRTIDSDVLNETTDGRLANYLFPEEALDCLSYCLSTENKYPHYIVSKRKFDRDHEKWVVNTKQPCGDSDNHDDTSLNSKHNKRLNHHKMLATVNRIFADCLDSNTIGNDDDFFDLGGDSLLAVRLHNALASCFPNILTLGEVMTNRTVNQLTKLINAKVDNINNEKAVDPSPLIQLKQSSSGQSIFLVHPVGGGIFCYLELAKQLPAELGCYAIQDPLLTNADNKFSSIAAMASYYKELIKSVSTRGPYLLGGYSFGGNVAFEIANQLVTDGDAVTRLYLIDSWATFSKAMHNYDHFMTALNNHFRYYHFKLPDNDKNKAILIRLLWARMHLLFQHQPKSLNVALVLFKAKEILPEYQSIDDDYNCWLDCISGQIEKYSVDGNHITLLRGVGAKRIGRIIGDLSMDTKI